MPYEKLGFTDDQEPDLEAKNLRHMEDGIATAQKTADEAKSAAATAQDTASGKADKSEIPDVSNFATKDEIPDVPDISGKADKSEIPDVSGFASQSALDDALSRIEALEATAGDDSGE